jgi:hypothetical protein
MKCECGKDLIIAVITTKLGNSINILECECGFLAVENDEGDEFVLQEFNSERDI